MKFCFYFLLIIFTNINFSSADSNVYFINIDLVIKNTNIGKKTLKMIKSINDKNIEELKTKEISLKKLDDDINSRKNVLSNEEFDNELVNFKKKVESYKNLKDKLVIDYENERNKNLNDLFKQINPIIQDYMNKNSINVLLDNKYVFMGKNNFDITNNIIDEINNNID